MGTKQDVTQLFQSQDAEDLGINKQSSDILIANLNANVLPMCVGTPVDQLDSDNVVIIQFVIDASPSMEPVTQLLIDTFNSIMIDGLKGASRQSVSSIVIGGLAFSTKIWPLWGGGFKKLNDLPPLTIADYDPSRGEATNLFQAQLDGVTAASAYATQVLKDTGTPPKVIVVGLTDGADNMHRADPADVKTLVEGMSRELWKFPMAVFETWEHVDGKQIAVQTGFDVFDFKKGASESEKEIQQRFRHMVGQMSSSLVSASKNKVGQANAQSTFWQQ